MHSRRSWLRRPRRLSLRASASGLRENRAVPPSAPRSDAAAAGRSMRRAKSADATRTPGAGPSRLAAVLMAPVRLGAVARDHALSTAALPPEPGLGETAKIEARLADLETAVKERSNDRARARLEAEKAETTPTPRKDRRTPGPCVTRLTGQVRDLQDKVQTLSTGADGKVRRSDAPRRARRSQSRRRRARRRMQGRGRGPAAQRAGRKSPRMVPRLKSGRV